MREETTMETTETLMADQLDAIIRRLTERIEADAELPESRGSSVKKLKTSLRKVQGIRAHFDGTK
jgi:uncharacterized protein (UPF0335 family)